MTGRSMAAMLRWGRIRTMRLATAFLALSGLTAAAELKLGKPLTLTEATTIGAVLADPGPLTGKTVQVKGKVTEVCMMMGCWMALADPSSGAILRVKVNDGDIVFPKESTGKMAVAEGKLAKIELTRDQAVARARHEAEEQGRKFDPNSVKSGVTIYQIQGAGAIVYP